MCGHTRSVQPARAVAANLCKTPAKPTAGSISTSPGTGIEIPPNVAFSLAGNEKENKGRRNSRRGVRAIESERED